MSKVFKDLVVVELSTVLAGPHVGMFFAEMGAHVIKVEHPKRKDVTRSWKLESESKDANVSAYFSSVNYNKDYVSIDLNSEQGRIELYGLLESADVLLVNFKKGSAEKLGLKLDELLEKYPQLIIGHITGFGNESERVAYDLILQAESGFMSMNGTSSSGPLKMPVALIDVLAAHHMKEALLIALIKRAKSGKGGYVSVSLYDAALSSLVNQATNWLMGQKIPERMGSLHPNIAPYGEVFATQDEKMITFAIGSSAQFTALCKVLQAPELLEDPQFSDNQSRVKNRAALFKLLQRKVQKMELNALVNACSDHHIPYGQIKNLKEVFDAQTAQQLLLKEKLEGIDTVRVKSFIARFSDE